MSTDFNLEEGSIINVRIGQSETTGRLVGFSYGKYISKNTSTLLLKMITEQGFSYIIPTLMIDNCSLIEKTNSTPRPNIKLISNWFLSLFRSIR